MTIIETAHSWRATRALSKASFTCAAALSAAAGIGALDGSAASAEHVPYGIARLGYVDNIHTSGSGQRRNNVTKMSAVGRIIGNQTRYDSRTSPTGQTAWYYNGTSLERIGLFDDAHVSAADVNNPGGEQISTVSHLNDLGHAAGVSHRYDGQTTQSGQSAWVYADGETRRVGLYESDHARDTGGPVSTLVALNAFGTVVGNSERYRTNSAFGYSAYIQLIDETESTRIGLDLDAAGTTYNEHRRSDGLQFSIVSHLNDLGHAAGITNRYVDGPDLTNIGNSAWLRSANGNTVKAGFTNQDHTRVTDGRKISTVVALNNVGQAVGHSTRYSPSTGGQQGQTAWIQPVGGTAPVRLGFTDGIHTRGNNVAAGGEKNSVVQELNDAGRARGFSTRYDGSTTSGQSAWMSSPTTDPERVGLINDEHTGTNGLQSSTAVLLNNTLHAAGTSSRFRTTETETKVAAGTSAWRHATGATATRVGFYDNVPGTIDHTRDSDESQTSSVIALNDPGDVVGHSTRYRQEETIAWGQTAWINDGGTGVDTRVGLFDFAHTRSPTSDDFQSSTVRFLNEDGHAVGTSARFNGNADQAGQSGWYFDGTTSIPLVFSQNPSDSNRTYTEISFLTDDGIALGFYEKYGVDAGNRAFLWDYNQDPDNRFHDLGEMVEGGLSTAGWAALTHAIEMSELGHILGIGTLAGDGSSMPFLMTPVPEPTGLALLALGGLALLPRRRR